MIYDSSTKQFSLNTEEYFQNVEDIPETPETIKAYIPKLMPKIQLGEGPNTKIKLQINRSIFINDNGCSIHITRRVIDGQNFVTLPHHPNERPNFRAKSELRAEGYIVPKHSTFIMGILHDDIQNMYFTGKS